MNDSVNEIKKTDDHSQRPCGVHFGTCFCTPFSDEVKQQLNAYCLEILKGITSIRWRDSNKDDSEKPK